MPDDQVTLITDVAGAEVTLGIAKVFDFFGIRSEQANASQFLALLETESATPGKARLVCAADVFWRLIQRIRQDSAAIRRWEESVHSVFVHPAVEAELLGEVAKFVTQDPDAVLLPVDGAMVNVSISGELNDFCGVFANLRLRASTSDIEVGLRFDRTKGETVEIISTAQGCTFLRASWQNVPVFLTTADVHDCMAGPVRGGKFDIRNCFFSTVPFALYVKAAFAATCWRAPETNACLIIDDPVLKPTYGFLNFQKLLKLMECHRFSTNLAFIPWNWRRSDPEVARLFRENPERYSLSIHGCDHTAGEFGSSDRAVLDAKVRRASQRMLLHEARTGVHHDRIMVFPQGVFSTTAAHVLKHNNFAAAVNTDATASGSDGVDVLSLWDIAVMNYCSFPIFTRRYPSDGIENFAFDILLGKPCLIVVHHDFFRDGCLNLEDFVDRLNNLNCAVTWRSLGDVVRRSCRQRKLASGTIELEMYGTELMVTNSSADRRRFVVTRRECDPNAVKEVLSGSDQLVWNYEDGNIVFVTDLASNQDTTIRVVFHEAEGTFQSDETISYRFRTAIRRYLCEVRDNYLQPALKELWHL